MHYERGGRCQPRRQISLTKNLGAPERAPRPIVVEHMQTIARPKSEAVQDFLEALFRTRTGDPLLTMELLRQPVAAGGNGFRLFLRPLRPRDLQPLATGCNHGAP